MVTEHTHLAQALGEGAYRCVICGDEDTANFQGGAAQDLFLSACRICGNITAMRPNEYPQSSLSDCCWATVQLNGGQVGSIRAIYNKYHTTPMEYLA